MYTPDPHHLPDVPTGEVELRRRPGRIRALLAAGSVLGLGVIATSAAFSDSAEVAASFTAGTLDLTVDGEEGNPTPYVLSFTGADAMVPGQTVHSPLRVSNVGTVDADLSMAVATTPDGSIPNATDDLRLVVASTTGTACDAGVVASDPAPLVADGTLGSATFTGVQLDGGAHRDLCLAVTLPASVTGTGGGATDLELAFTADQADL